jgi:hypothetical protein
MWDIVVGNVSEYEVFIYLRHEIRSRYILNYINKNYFKISHGLWFGPLTWADIGTIKTNMAVAHT